MPCPSAPRASASAISAATLPASDDGTPAAVSASAMNRLRSVKATRGGSLRRCPDLKGVSTLWPLRCAPVSYEPEVSVASGAACVTVQRSVAAPYRTAIQTHAECGRAAEPALMCWACEIVELRAAEAARASGVRAGFGAHRPASTRERPRRRAEKVDVESEDEGMQR